jgi:hypothetical protein
MTTASPRTSTAPPARAGPTRGSLRRAIAPLAVASVLALGVTWAGVLGALYSVAVNVSLRDGWAAAAAAQRISVEVMRGDLDQAVGLLEQASAKSGNAPTHASCLTLPGYESLQRAELQRLRGNVAEARKLYAEAMAQASAPRCGTAHAADSDAQLMVDTARRRLGEMDAAAR